MACFSSVCFNLVQLTEIENIAAETSNPEELNSANQELEEAEESETSEEPTLETLKIEIRKIRQSLLSEQHNASSKILVLSESLEKIKSINAEKEKQLASLKEQITKDQSKIMREIQAKFKIY